MDSILIEQLSAPRRSLRLAVVTETYPPEVNGVAISLARFVDGLRERNHDIQLIRPRQGHAEQASSGNGFAEVLTGGMPIPHYPNLKMGLPAKRMLIKEWTLHRPDIVHIVTEGPLGWSALQVAHKLRIPVCSDFRTNFHAYSLHYGIGWLKKPIVAYLRKFHNRTLLTMVPTEQMRADLAALGFRNLHVVTRGVDTQLFSPHRRSELLRLEWGATSDTPVVLHVGRLAAEKNLEALVTAFNSIRQHQPGARLVLVGDGPEEANLRSHLPDAVFAGMRRGESLATHYASADLFLFPSCTETFGNVTLEAMSSGLPVVAYRHAAAAELIRSGENGQLIEPGAEDDFQRAAVQLAEMHTLRAQMGQEARITALGQAWPLIFQKTEKIFRQVIQDHAPQLG